MKRCFSSAHKSDHYVIFNSDCKHKHTIFIKTFDTTTNKCIDFTHLYVLNLFSVPLALKGHINMALHHSFNVDKMIINGVSSENNKDIIHLQAKTLILASCDGLCDIILVIAVKYEGQIIHHFIEGGRFTGFLHHSEHFPPSLARYRTYTPDDIKTYRREQGLKGQDNYISIDVFNTK